MMQMESATRQKPLRVRLDARHIKCATTLNDARLHLSIAPYPYQRNPPRTLCPYRHKVDEVPACIQMRCHHVFRVSPRVTAMLVPLQILCLRISQLVVVDNCAITTRAR
eukprot:813028-Rhodomonas_salina.3